MKFATDNVKRGVLTYISEKTKTPIQVPLNAMAKQILIQYKKLPNKKLLPQISNQKYNKYLRELGEDAKLKRIVEYRNKKGNIDKKEIWELMSTHMARRIFIGNSINVFDIRTEVIQSITGHTKNSKAFARYYDIDIQTKKKALNSMK